VFNPKVLAFAGGAGFILSLLIGMISGAGFLMALIRALIFAALFAGMAAGASWLIVHFLPELIEAEDAEVNVPGSRVNISVEGDVPEDGLDPNADSFGGNVLGLDHGAETGYTEGKDESVPAFGAAAETASTVPAVPTASDQGEEADAVDVLPDLEAMSEVFLPPAGEEELSSPQRSVAGNRPENLEGDFNAKEMAAAIRTILKREEKG
jgi:hypothetical protein